MFKENGKKENLERIKKERLAKIEKLESLSIDPYPATTFRTHSIADVISDFGSLVNAGTKVSIAGRINSWRSHGKVSFFDLKDESGRIQVFIEEKTIGKGFYDDILPIFDVGDFAQVQGKLFITKRGENTINAQEIKILSKSISPLPREWFGLKDKEEKFRKRYIDILLNEEVAQRFRLRSRIITQLRSLLDDEGFLEVETPILQTLYGGANAKPFKTKLNALKMNLYLRIAPELYLKRLVVAGFEKIYEIGKNFRNEGIDRNHNPEFTSLELYWSYHDDQELMNFTEKLIENLVKSLFNKDFVEFSGKQISFKTPWQRLRFSDIFNKKLHLDPIKASIKDLSKKAKESGLIVNKKIKRDTLIDELYKKVVVNDVVNPTYIYDIPTMISPLAKSYKDNPEIARRFQGYVFGVEFINAFSELNNSLEQEKRFREEQKERQDPHPYDKNFIEVLSYGMPPCAGLGIGLDRLVRVLTNTNSLKEVILFPFMKEK